ncbi:hypothetical protein [Streptomyces sp. NPDC017993]|uniref:hypothetical protein n=1 Tax=Streptomyces sp. NPDC017993 TaxID=3365027 RepID=UPI0037BB73F7
MSVFIPSNALNGSRRHRLAVGSILTLFMVLLAVALTAAAVSTTERAWPLIGFASAAFSLYAVAWWCARYWYAAFREGRSAPPVAQPHPWPWLLPLLVIDVAFAVTGIGAVQDGKTAAAVFSLVLAAVILLPAAIFLMVELHTVRERCSRTQGASAAGQNAPEHEPQRPHRDWGSIG